MKADTPKAFWLVQTQSEFSRGVWHTTAIDVDATRTWSSSQVVAEYNRRYSDSSSKIRVAPIDAPKSWDTFKASLKFVKE